MSCERKDKWIGGCDFQAVYNEALPDGSQFGNIEGSAIGCIEFVNAHKNRTFVGTFCTRCGKRGEV